MRDNTTFHLKQLIRTEKGMMSKYLSELVRNSVVETLNQLWDAVANKLYRAEK